MIGSTEFIESPCLAHVISIFPLLRIFLVDRHHVLKVVSLRAEVWSLSDSPRVLFDEHFLVLRNEAFRSLVIEPSCNLAFKALRRVVRIALSIQVLRVYTTDKACVAWDALVANIMSGPIHPGA